MKTSKLEEKKKAGGK